MTEKKQIEQYIKNIVNIIEKDLVEATICEKGSLLTRSSIFQGVLFTDVVFENNNIGNYISNVVYDYMVNKYRFIVLTPTFTDETLKDILPPPLFPKKTIKLHFFKGVSDVLSEIRNDGLKQLIL